MIITNESELQERYARLQQEKSNLRIREAARELSVSEAALVMLKCGSDRCIRLQGPWGDLMQKVPSLGRVMALTRNEAAVHERKGRYEQVEIFGPMGQVVGADIDLRLFLNRWHVGFALREEVDDATRRSLQVFDKHGVAIHKIYLQGDSNVEAFDEIVRQFADANQETTQCFEPEPAVTADRPDEEVDLAEFRQTWDSLANTHEFFGMVQKFKLGREQALRLAGDERARRVRTSAVRELFEKAAASGIRIMIFVGNRGIIQIHSGPVQNIKVMGPWLNVLDPDFNLHLREDLIAQAWVVRKATNLGTITSLEIYDAAGENIALFFGKRPQEEGEPLAWRELVESSAKQ